MENLTDEKKLAAALAQSMAILQRERNRLDDCLQLRTALDNLNSSLGLIKPMQLEAANLEKRIAELTEQVAAKDAILSKKTKEITAKDLVLANQDRNIADRNEKDRTSDARETAVTAREAAVELREKRLADAAAILGAH